MSHIVGKWHLGLCNKKFWPHYRGFDSFNGMLQGGGTYTNHSLQGGYDYRDNNKVRDGIRFFCNNLLTILDARQHVL